MKFCPIQTMKGIDSIRTRFFPVDIYLVFYFTKVSGGVINIVSIMYGGLNTQRQLNETI